MYVELQATKVRMEPTHWGAGIATVAYGEPLTVLATQGAWFKVRLANGNEGFIHSSAVTKRAVLLKATANTPTSLSQDSSAIVLAGKGFNAELEALLAAEDASLDFTKVDKIETFKVSEMQSLRFLQDGKLRSDNIF